MNYAALSFDRFVWRFGQLVAVFYSIGLKAAAGYDPGIRLSGPMVKAEVVFMNRRAVDDHRERLRENRMDTDEMDFVLSSWPERAEQSKVEGYINGY